MSPTEGGGGSGGGSGGGGSGGGGGGGGGAAGGLVLLVITASGMLFTQPLATADSSSGPHLLTGTIQIPSELRGRVGASLHYSPPCALLFTVYADGRCYALRLDDAASEVLGGFVVHGTRIDYLSSGALGAAKSAASPYSHWQDVPGQRGLLLACCRKTLMPVAVRVTPAQVELQVLKPHAKAEGLAAAPTSPRALSTAAGGASEGAAVCWVLHEDGSMQCHTCGRSSDTEGAFQQALARAAKRPPGRPPSFPVDFFERTTCVTANPEISLGGDVVHNSTPSTAKQRLSPNTDDYVSSPHKASLTLTIHNASSQQVLAGVRVLLGSAHPQHIPASFTLFGRTISTQEGQRRWYDVPFTDAEAVVGQKEVCIVFSATHTGVNVPVLDALDVYARSKADFGWDGKVEELTARYKLQLAPQAAGKGGGGGGARAEDASPKEPQATTLAALESSLRQLGAFHAAAAHGHGVGDGAPMRGEMLALLPSVLTAGPACAPLRSPAKVLLRQLLPGREGYLALKDEALLRHAAACIGAAPPAPADAPMLEGDDAADAVAPPPVTASSLTHQIAAIQRIVRKRPHNLFAFTQANPSFFGALCAAFRSVQAAAARLAKLPALTKALVQLLLACAEQQAAQAVALAGSGGGEAGGGGVGAAAADAARPSTSSCRSCSSTAARRSVSQRARRLRRSCSPRRPPRRRSPPPTWTAAAVPAAVPAAAARAAAARAAAAAARAARAAAAARAARGRARRLRR